MRLAARGRLLPLVAAVSLAACTGVAIQSELPEREANEIVGLLLRSGIGAEKVASSTGQGRFTVEVSASDAARAFDVLREAGLPRPPSTGFAELYSGDRLVPSVSEERARLHAALTGELARSIETIDGILEARVHLAVPEPDAIDEGSASRPARASVLVRYGPPTPPYDEQSIRRLVAGGVPGLEEANVAVIGVPRSSPAVGASTVLVQVAGIRVDPGSAGTLKVVLAGLLLVPIALSVALVAVVARNRRPRGGAPRSAS